MSKQRRPRCAGSAGRKDWNAELSSWSDEDFAQVFHERPDLADRLRRMLDEPVATVLPPAQPDAALGYEPKNKDSK